MLETVTISYDWCLPIILPDRLISSEVPMFYVGAEEGEEGKGLKTHSVSGSTPLSLFLVFLPHVYVSII